MSRSRYLALILGCALCACDGPLSLHIDWIRISTSQNSSVNVGISFRLFNSTSGTLYVDACAGGIERRTGSGWRLEVGRTCGRDPAANLRPPIELRPNVELRDTSFSHAQLQAGEYRGVFFVRTHATSGRWRAAYSNVFQSVR